MSTYDRFGFEINDIEMIKSKIEKTCQIEFIEHESEFYGIYFLAKLENGEIYKLYENYFDGCWQDDEFQNCYLLLDIDRVIDKQRFLNVNAEVGALPLRRSDIVKNGEFKVNRIYKFNGDEFYLESEQEIRKRNRRAKGGEI